LRGWLSWWGDDICKESWLEKFTKCTFIKMDNILGKEPILRWHEQLYGINENLINNLPRPYRWNARKEILDIVEDQWRDYEILQKLKDEEMKSILWTLSDENPLYQLNEKVSISIEDHPELKRGRIENVFNFSEDIYDDSYYDDDYYYDDYNDDYSDDEYNDDEHNDDEHNDDEHNDDEHNDGEDNDCGYNYNEDENYSNILLEIQQNYEKAIWRHSDYVADLKRHIATWNWLVYSPFVNDTSVLVGQLVWDIFLVSHFAPSSMKMWYKLIKEAMMSKMPIVFAVPDFLSKQLEKAWFTNLWYKIPQIFNWEVILKNILVNNAVTEGDLKTLIDTFTTNYSL